MNNSRGAVPGILRDVSLIATGFYTYSSFVHAVTDFQMDIPYPHEPRFYMHLGIGLGSALVFEFLRRFRTREERTCLYGSREN